MNTINEVKSISGAKGITLTNVAKYITEHSGKNIL